MSLGKVNRKEGLSGQVEFGKVKSSYTYQLVGLTDFPKIAIAYTVFNCVFWSGKCMGGSSPHT